MTSASMKYLKDIMEKILFQSCTSLKTHSKT